MARLKPNQAFTLIELLVVIAIIALLISILLPALGRTKEKGRQAACLSNLHHLGQAFQQYLADNGDDLPPAAEMPSLELLTADPNQRALPITEYLRYTAKNLDVFRCPSDMPGKIIRDTLDPNILGRSYWETEKTSYEYNFIPWSRWYVYAGTGGERPRVNVGDSVLKMSPPGRHRHQNWFGTKLSDFYLLTEYEAFHGKRGNQEIRHTLYGDFHVEEQRHYPFAVDPNDPNGS